MYRAQRWYLSAEYTWREPSVGSNTIFSLVDFDRYSIGRLEGRRSVWRDVSILAHVQTDLSGANDVWRTGIGFAGRSYSLSYIRQSGDGGDNDGITGYLNLRLNRRWECYANANLYQYRVQEEQGERSDAYASSLGVRWRAGRGVSVRSEIQYLSNGRVGRRCPLPPANRQELLDFIEQRGSTVMKRTIPAVLMLTLFVGGTLMASRFPQAEFSMPPSDIIFAHANHIDLECTDCHADISQSDNAGDRNFPTMDICADCHDIESDDNCGLCHRNPEEPGATPASGSPGCL